MKTCKFLRSVFSFIITTFFCFSPPEKLYRNVQLLEAMKSDATEVGTFIFYGYYELLTFALFTGILGENYPRRMQLSSTGSVSDNRTTRQFGTFSSSRSISAGEG